MKRLFHISLFLLVLHLNTEARILDSLFVSGGERRAITVPQRDFEIAFGTGGDQIGYERKEGKFGLLYDLSLKENLRLFIPLRLEFSDRFRAVWDLSWQSFKLVNEGIFRLGGAFNAEGYTNWKMMLVLEAGFVRKYLLLEGTVMSDLGGDWRWLVQGGPRIPINRYLTLEWRLDHWGDQNIDYGGSKLVITVKFI
jgi:hypothetical protein